MPHVPSFLSTSTRNYGHDRLSAHAAGCARSALSPEGTNTSPYLCIEGLRQIPGTHRNLLHSLRSRPWKMSMGEEVLDRVGHLGEMAIEEVVGAVDDNQFLGFGRPAVELPDVTQGTEFVPLAVNEVLRIGGLLHGGEVEQLRRQRDAD